MLHLVPKFKKVCKKSPSGIYVDTHVGVRYAYAYTLRALVHWAYLPDLETLIFRV